MPFGIPIRAPGPRFDDMTLGIPYVEFTVPMGTAAGIAKFYKKVIKSPAKVSKDPEGVAARVRVGNNQELIFRETTTAIPDYDGHHIAVYVANFSGPHRFLSKHGLVTEETNEFQYRFVDIVDPDTGKTLFEIEHEVRSLHHPMFGRERGFVNRNPDQNLQAYSRGRDAFVAS